MRIRSAAAMLLVLLPGSALAGIEQAGTTAANFLSIGADASAVGMGGATLGIGSGLNAASWNPAALGRLDQTELLFAHAGLAQQSAQEWASIGGRMGSTHLRWAISGLFQGDGSFQGRDASNNSIGNFDVSSSAFGVQLARPIGPFASAGLGAKFASEKLGNVSGSGVTFDAGLSARSGMFGFGLAAQNVGGSMKYEAASYPFPANFGAGVSFTHPITGLRLALDANFPSAYYSDVRGGIEWRWNDHFALRTGYRAELGAGPNEPMSGQTFGMGLGVAGMWLDYGYLVSGNGGGQQRIGLAFHPSALGLGAGGSSARIEPDEAPGPAAPKPAPVKTAGPDVPVAKTASAPATPKPPTTLVAPNPASAMAAAGTASAMSSANPVRPAPAPKPASDAVVQKPAKVTVTPKPVPEVVAPMPAPPAAVEALPAPAASGAEAATGAASGLMKANLRPDAAPVAAPAPASGLMKANLRPDAAPVAAPAPRPVVRPGKVTVGNGETLESIAKRWGTSAAAIMMENNLVKGEVRRGQVLKLPKLPKK